MKITEGMNDVVLFEHPVKILCSDSSILPAHGSNVGLNLRFKTSQVQNLDSLITVIKLINKCYMSTTIITTIYTTMSNFVFVKKIKNLKIRHQDVSFSVIIH